MKKKKKVIYNGGTEAMHYTSDASILKRGKKYTVTEEIVGGWQTNYRIRRFFKKIKGEFNSVWFNVV